MATITLNGDLKLDQTAGLQDDDVELNVVVNPGDGNDVLADGLDADFLAFLNSLGATQLTDEQKSFAALVEGASNPNMVSVTLSTGETVSKLFFSDATGSLFDGDQVFISPGVPMQTINGDNIFLWSSLDGSKVLATTGSATDSVVAAFFLESNNALNTSANVESVTFIPIAHPDPNNPDDTVDFGTIMKISAVVSTTPDLEVDDDGPTAPTVVVSTTVTHDETAGVQGAPTATDPNPQNDVALADLPADVAALFGNIGGTAIGFAAGTAPLVTLSGGEFGTDGPADTDSVIFDAFVNDGTFSGLSTTAGTQIFLYNGTGSLDGLILGRVGIEGGTTDTADPGGAVAYAVFVDPATGVGYIAQHLALNHGAGGSDAAAYDNEIAVASDAVQITVTFTDHDGDQDTSDPVAIGNQLRFQDDGPTITFDPVALSISNTAPGPRRLEDHRHRLHPDSDRDARCVAG